MSKLRKALEDFIRLTVLDSGFAIVPREKWPEWVKGMKATHPREWAHQVAMRDGRMYLFAASGEQGETKSDVNVMVFFERGVPDHAKALIAEIFSPHPD